MVGAYCKAISTEQFGQAAQYAKSANKSDDQEQKECRVELGSGCCRIDYFSGGWMMSGVPRIERRGSLVELRNVAVGA